MKNNTQIMKRSDFLKTYTGATSLATRVYDEKLFMNSFQLLLSESDGLQECLESKKGQISLYNALKRAASSGLSLNPLEGKATIIAYKGVASYQVMSKGLVELAIDSGNVKGIMIEAVRENDEFYMERTMDGDMFKFVPALEDRGGIKGFFASMKLKDGEVKTCWMTKQQVDEHRDAFSSNYNFAKDKAKSPWVKSYEGMGGKTVLKKLLNNQHISPAVSAAIISDYTATGEIIDIDGVVTEPDMTGAEKVKATLVNDGHSPI